MLDLKQEILVWVIFLVFSIPYVMWAKHPASRLVAAYLIFVTIFSVVGWIAYSFLSLLLSGYVEAVAGDYKVLQLLVFGVSILLGILLAHWQLRKPPRASPPI